MKNLYQYECHLVESSSPLLSLERNYKNNNHDCVVPENIHTPLPHVKDLPYDPPLPSGFSKLGPQNLLPPPSPPEFPKFSKY